MKKKILKEKTGMFKRLSKSLPELNKQSLVLFRNWWDERIKIKKILSDRELNMDEVTTFKNICTEFLEFGEKNKLDYEKNKIPWSVMENYLTKDIEFCNNLFYVDAFITKRLGKK